MNEGAKRHRQTTSSSDEESTRGFSSKNNSDAYKKSAKKRPFQLAASNQLDKLKKRFPHKIFIKTDQNEFLDSSLSS